MRPSSFYGSPQPMPEPAGSCTDEPARPLVIAHHAVNRISSASMTLAPLTCEPGAFGARTRQTVADLDRVIVDIRTAVLDSADLTDERLHRVAAVVRACVDDLELAREASPGRRVTDGDARARLAEAARTLRELAGLLGCPGRCR